MADDTTQDSTAEQDTPPQEHPETGASDREVKQDVPPEVKAALRKANKEAEALRLKLKEFEDRDKTEQQRANERAEAAEKRAAKAESDAARIRVAASKGLPADLAERLRGDDEEAMAEDADRLLELIKPRRGADVDQGPRGTGRPGQLTRDDLKGMTPQQIVAAKKDGRLSALLTAK